MMKWIFFLVLMFMLILVLITPIYAGKTANIDELLLPYQEVIDKINAELGSTIYIPDVNKEKVYNNIKDMSPEEVEILLRNEYNACASGESITNISKNGDYIRDYAMKNDANETVITSNYFKEEITQEAPISYNSEMFLDSIVISVTGKPGTFSYQSIRGYGSQWPSDYTGYHYEVDSGLHSLSDDRKKCTVSLKGHPEDANGFALLVTLTETVTFSAN